MSDETLAGPSCPFAASLNKTWRGMIDRCYRRKHAYYRNYGGRGITVCDRWRASLDAFAWDVGERPSPGHSIDRIDNDGPYAPSNIRWATRIQQHRNKRNNRHITAYGETLTLAEWAERTGMRKEKIRNRLRLGWIPEDALSLPRRQAKAPSDESYQTRCPKCGAEAGYECRRPGPEGETIKLPHSSRRHSFDRIAAAAPVERSTRPVPACYLPLAPCASVCYSSGSE